MAVAWEAYEKWRGQACIKDRLAGIFSIVIRYKINY